MSKIDKNINTKNYTGWLHNSFGQTAREETETHIFYTIRCKSFNPSLAKYLEKNIPEMETWSIDASGWKYFILRIWIKKEKPIIKECGTCNANGQCIIEQSGLFQKPCEQWVKKTKRKTTNGKNKQIN